MAARAVAAVVAGPVVRTKRYTRKSRSISYRKHLTSGERVELLVIQAELGVIDYPKTRGDCVNAARPCPFVTCRHHLYLEVEPTGTIKLNHPDVEVAALGETCSLDVADRGAATLDDVGRLLNVTRERTRQIEVKALRIYADGCVELDINLREFLEGGDSR